DLRSSANAAVVQGVESAIKSASMQVHAQAFMEGKTAASDTDMDYAGTTIKVYDGYPTTNWGDSIKVMIDIDTKNGYTPKANKCNNYAFCGVGDLPPANASGLSLTGGQVAIIWPNGYFINDQCYAYYHLPENGTAPTIGSNISGC
ncbi:MAG: hypothetical protein HRU20_18605, partial [Pseudomonadales bacterium]|nr:hypothetical protein [Pseudomonadales bacterium]